MRTSTLTFTQRPTAYLIAYYAALVTIGLLVGSLGPTLQGLAAQTGSTLAAISVLFVARSTGYILSTSLIGRVFDRLPGHPLMAGAVVGIALCLALTPLAPWLALLVALMAVLGAMESTVDVGGNTLLVWAFSEQRDRVGPYMNGLHFAFGVGAFLSPIVVAQAISLGGGIAWGYWILAALVLPVALLILRVPSPAAPAKSHEAARSGASNRTLVVLIAAFYFLYVGAEVGFGGWAATYATRTGLADEASAAYLTSAFWGALTAGRLLAIPLAARVRPRTLIAANVLGSLLSVGLALLWQGSAAALWAAALGAGLSMASTFPTMLTMAERRLQLTGALTSTFFLGAGLGGMFVPWLIGQLFEPFGPPAALVLIFSTLVGMAAVFAVIVLLAPGPKAQTPASDKRIE
jgi:FHS family Na+ dependent glucose MFS transporter 1